MTCISEWAGGDKSQARGDAFSGGDPPGRLHNAVCSSDLQPMDRPLLMDLVSAFAVCLSSIIGLDLAARKTIMQQTEW